jgi:hypothetical protein
MTIDNEQALKDAYRAEIAALFDVLVDKLCGGCVEDQAVCEFRNGVKIVARALYLASKELP